MDSFFWRAWRMGLFFVWVIYFWCVFAPLALGTLEQCFGLRRPK